MYPTEWEKEFPASINICDTEGKLLYLNRKAIKTLEKDGGEKLIGTNIIGCHPEGESRDKLVEILKQGSVNCYIVEKENKRKFVYQAPWFEDGNYKGIVELVMEIPEELVTRKRL